MVEVSDAIKSIVLGLKIQTESNQIKWLDKYELSNVDETNKWRKRTNDNLTIDIFYRFDNETLVEATFNLNPNHSILSRKILFWNEEFQNRVISFDEKFSPESTALLDVLYKKYVTKILNSRVKNYGSDVDILSKMVQKCGIEAVRDHKINGILNEISNPTKTNYQKKEIAKIDIPVFKEEPKPKSNKLYIAGGILFTLYIFKDPIIKALGTLLNF